MSREITLAVDVEAAPERITDALTRQEGLASFWTSDVTASPEVGAELRFGFEPAPTDLLVTLAALEPGGGLTWTPGDAWPHWAGTSIRWSLLPSPMGSGTRVLLVHDGWDDGYADGDLGSIAYTWSLVIGALKGYLETGTPQPALR